MSKVIIALSASNESKELKSLRASMSKLRAELKGLEAQESKLLASGKEATLVELKAKASELRKEIKANGTKFVGSIRGKDLKPGTFTKAANDAYYGGKIYKIESDKRTLLCTFSSKGPHGPMKGYIPIWTASGKKYFPLFVVA
jgi:hypothetical protein